MELAGGGSTQVPAQLGRRARPRRRDDRRPVLNPHRRGADMQILKHAGIVVIGDAAYEKEVPRLVERMLRTKTGEAVMLKIRSHGTAVVLASDPDDAEASSQEFTFMGTRARVDFYPNTKQDRANVSLLGPGGTTLKVRTFRMSPGWGPDEVLFHELVHAGRILGGDDGPLTEEEFFAVLVANIYISEKGKSHKDLRYRYEALSRGMTEAEVEPFVFLLQFDEKKKEDHFDLIDKYCRQHPQIAPMIGKAPAKFNPIRDYYALDQHLLDLTLRADEAPGPIPVRITQNYARVPLTDEYLISLLEPRFRADDEAGYLGRARKLEEVFAGLIASEAVPLLIRLVTKRSGDRVAFLFHGHLATATRARLIKVLRTRLTR
jgi:hypothetical protein